MIGCDGSNGPDPYADYIKIYNWTDLDNIRNNLLAKYILMNDLDSTTLGYAELASDVANGGKGWQPIGTYNTTFTGTFDGQGYEIRDLFIYRPSEDYVGLFCFLGEGEIIENIGVVNFNVTGVYGVGGLAGWNEGNMTACYATGSATGNIGVGGLVGVSCGPLLGGSRQDTITHCYATSSATGEHGVGGLVGLICGNVTNCYAVGNVTGEWYVGGLVGGLCGSVTNCYAVGSVTGEWCVGGLVGGICGPSLGCEECVGSLSNSYATGSITGGDCVGGLVGFNNGMTTNSYSTGSVSGASNVGGLVGTNDGNVANSFWDTETSGQATSDGGTGKNTTEMQNIAIFTDTETEGLDEPWNIILVGNPGIRNLAYIWNIVDDETYPFLSWQP